MKEFIFRSIRIQPSGKLWVKYTTNPNIAKHLGGVLTCTSCFDTNILQNAFPSRHSTLSHLSISQQK